MNWSEWGPTITTVICWVFFGGIAWNRLSTHEARLNEHDKFFEDKERRDTNQDVALAKLESFQEGYATARAIYHQNQGGD